MSKKIKEGMFRFTRICTRFPKAVVALTILLTIFFAWCARSVERDHSMDRMLPPDEPIRVFYDEFRKHFNIQSKIVIAIYHPEGIYTPAVLEQVERLTQNLEKIDLLDDVESLSSVENITAEDGMITVAPLAQTMPKTEAEVKEFAKAARANPMIRNGLVAKDETSTVIFAQPGFEIYETAKATRCAKMVKEITGADPGPAKIYVTGFPMVIGQSNQFMDRDNKVMLPLVGLLVVLLLFASFRSLRGVWIPLGVVVAAVIWTYGFIGLVGMKTTLICASIPIVLASMGIADGIHVLHEYYHHLRKGLSNLDAVHATMKEMNSPVVMTSLTTAVGFCALSTSKIVPIGEYGLAVALGIMWAMVFSLSFIPAALVLLGKPKKILSAKVTDQGLMERFSIGMGRFSLNHTTKIIVTFVILLIITGALATRLKVRNNPVEYFRQNSDLPVSDRFLNKHFAGTGEILVQIDGKKPGALKNPELLAEIDRFQKRLEEMPEVGRATSVTDFLKRMNVVLNDDNEAYDRVPGTSQDMGADWSEDKGRAKVAQYYLLYETSGGEDLAQAVDFTYQRAHVHIFVKSQDSNDYHKVMDHLEAAYAEIFKPGETILGVTGAGAINLKVVKYLVQGQVISLVVSFIAVFIMLVFLFKSFRDAVIGSIPLIITVSINFAFMVLTDIPLNMGTALIASVIIGVGVDYSIHFIHRYRLESERKDSIEDTIDETMDTSGRAIMFNALSVGGGFAILLASSFMPLVYIGVLVPLVMIVNAFAALLVIPAFLNRRAKKMAG